MTYLLISVMSLLILAYVIYPLFKNAPGVLFPDYSGAHIKLRGLNQLKFELLRAIKEIDFEYQLGKMSQEDYENLKVDYQNQALEVLQEIDNHRKSLVSQKKHGKKHRTGQNNHTAKETVGRSESVIYCAECGAANNGTFNFCTSCGAMLQKMKRHNKK